MSPIERFFFFFNPLNPLLWYNIPTWLTGHSVLLSDPLNESGFQRSVVLDVFSFEKEPLNNITKLRLLSSEIVQGRQ